ncbi:MAG: ABC transporter substrate-binding protein [Acidimicrobiia bacterium]
MKRFKWLALLLALAMIAAACGGDDSDSDGGDGDGDGGPLAGTEVSIFGAFTTVEASVVNQIIDESFEADTGGSATYEGSDSFEEQIKIRVDGGNPPDIALYPQPGSVLEQAESGAAIALEDLGVDIALLEATFGEYLVSLGEFNGKHYGIPTNVNTKGLIWYPLPEFTDAGYEPPETWDELIALSDQMVADGVTPWCHGIGSEAATGWPATDWMESIMLNTAGADVYDQWVLHEIPFNDATVKRAAVLFGDTVFPEGYTLGGAEQVPAIDFRDAPDPLFNDPPSCFLFRQASFITNFFPEGNTAGVDYGVFPFPAIDEGVSGALIAGEMAAVFRDAPEVKAFIESFISEEVQCAQGGFDGVQRISPNINVGASCYIDELTASQAQSITDALKAGGARFDASDLMPSAVGSGSFWTGMVDYMRGGPESLDEVLQDIEDSWPTS